MSNASGRPRLVLVGRPNVGKSTLFNRICGNRRAITDPTPGVTRDLLEEKCLVSGLPVVLVDTGGVKPEYEGAFDDIVAHRSLETLEDADAIIFIVEMGGMTREDEFLAEKLRIRTDRVVLAVNKSDTPQKDVLAGQFYSLGFGDPVPISAVHGRNIGNLEDATRRRLEKVGVGLPDGTESETEDDSIVSVALVGRPNVGKSTLSNRLIGKDCSLVSEVAGTTRDTVMGEILRKGQRLRVLDTAGIRRRARVFKNVEYYSVNRAIKAMFGADVSVLLIDAVEGLSDQDKKITDQAVKKGGAVVLALNKQDLLDSGQRKKTLDRIRFQFPVLDWAPLVSVSALDGQGVTELLNTVVRANRQQNRRVNTSELNKAVREWVDLTPPPTRKGRTFKVRYVTQVSTKPVRFVAFVNHKAGFPDSYRRFLVNRIREEFSFNLIPIALELREGEQ